MNKTVKVQKRFVHLAPRFTCSSPCGGWREAGSPDEQNSRQGREFRQVGRQSTMWVLFVPRTPHSLPYFKGRLSGIDLSLPVGITQVERLVDVTCITRATQTVT